MNEIQDAILDVLSERPQSSARALRMALARKGFKEGSLTFSEMKVIAGKMVAEGKIQCQRTVTGNMIYWRENVLRKLWSERWVTHLRRSESVEDHQT